MIILISSVDDLKLFGVDADEKSKKFLFKFWPGKVSIVLPITVNLFLEKFYYLHRGTKTLAFRLPDDELLSVLLSKVGPLVAPSANLEGFPPATTIEEAKNYFGNQLDFYISGGKIENKPSKLIKITTSGKIIELRK